MGMGKEDKNRERIEAVLQILRKQMSLRSSRYKGDNAKKAAKHLRACLCWRDAIGIEHLMADEFSEELAEGAAYVAGHDDDARPVILFRIKQDYVLVSRSRTQFCRYMRLLVFTLEVAISSISRFVEQFVLLFDASFFRSASAFLNLFMGTLKIISEYYPGRLHKAFVIDPPSLFPYLWKGSRPFVDLWTSTAVVWSLDFEDSLEEHRPFAAADHHRPGTTSLRFDPSTVSSAAASTKIGGGSTSSRFSFTVSRFDSLKPWYLTRTEPSPAAPPTPPPPPLAPPSPGSPPQRPFLLLRLPLRPIRRHPAPPPLPFDPLLRPAAPTAADPSPILPPLPAAAMKFFSLGKDPAAAAPPPPGPTEGGTPSSPSFGSTAAPMTRPSTVPR
ncbi:unnamed protein product [Spirodela intermedia]|uniref:CRAL-TRIO domain-containing protein n=1 Tax=Spirodela intermedia TaxID=51605 RepID=A0A7I8J0C3_SPIIN|nr:unnamed protein product [Spirodela intermedia]CAA6662881.1 unnamed protein product [Spirodela intermedia]